MWSSEQIWQRNATTAKGKLVFIVAFVDEPVTYFGQ